MSQKSGEALQEKHIQLQVYYYNVPETNPGKKQNGSDQQCVKKEQKSLQKISS
jgi:hypothetical protein